MKSKTRKLNGARIEIIKANDLASLQRKVNEFIAGIYWELHDVRILDPYPFTAMVIYDTNS